MGSSIPASAIVNVLPSVISAGGNGLDLVGLVLTTSARMPTGTILSFASPADVLTYFGPASAEYAFATTYFAGYAGATQTPGVLLFYCWPASAVAAFLRGGSMAGVTLTQLQAFTGTLTLVVDGVSKTSSAINLSAATSFSNAATIIQAAFTAPGFTITYDSIASAFVVTSSTTGVASTVVAATGTSSLADNLKLSATTLSVLSQGSAAVAAGAVMDQVIALTQDFVSFTTLTEPSDASGNKLAFAAWASGKNNRYAYVGFTATAAAKTSSDTTSIGALVITNNYGSVIPVYDPTNGVNVAAFIMGAIASFDFTAFNGRATLAFRTNGDIAAGVTSRTDASNLLTNGYNLVGAYATAAQGFTFVYNGQISGPFNWIDSWVCQVWMNNAFQLALMELLTSVGQIPYNNDGYTLIRNTLLGVINAALNFGAIRAGVALSAQQQTEVNNAAGGQVANTLAQQGYYIKVADPGAAARAARSSPNVTVFYTDGQSVQQINLSSVNVQ